MNLSRTTTLRNAVLASATSPLNLGVGGGSLLIAVASAWFDFGGNLLPSATIGLGILAYLSLIALDVRSPEFIRKANSTATDPTTAREPLVEPKELVDPLIRNSYSSVIEALEKARHAFEHGSDALQSGLEDGLHHAGELARVASRAARRSNGIYRYLQSATPDSLSVELTKLQDLSRSTTDATARRDFEQAASAKARELETYGQLQGLRDRIHAQLLLIETSLDGLSAKLVKLDATDLAEAIAINESLSNSLQTMTSDVEILESTYDETMQELRA